MADPKGLAIIIVNATTAKATEVLTNITALLRQAGPGEASPLYYCSTLYIPMASQTLALTIMALHWGQLREVNQILRRAGTVPQLCARGNLPACRRWRMGTL
ncbi:hypothetical protein NL676_031071 [Syzygium grande]|nr:hypothetical protein NL676_031071 [Syzygium grande]